MLGEQLINLPSDLRTKALRWFNNDIYDQPFKRLADVVANDVARGRRVLAKQSQALGFLSEGTIKNLEQRARIPVGAALIASDVDIARWIRGTNNNFGDAVPLSIAGTLPSIIRSPDAILWDRENRNLIYARRLANGRYAQFILNLSFKTDLNTNRSRFNETLNTFKNSGVVDATVLDDQNLEIILGEIVLP